MGVFQLRPIPSKEWWWETPPYSPPLSSWPTFANGGYTGIDGGVCALTPSPLPGRRPVGVTCLRQAAQPSPRREAESLARLPQKLPGCCLTRHPRPPACLQLLASPSPMDALPEPLLVRILAGLPALDLVLVCRLVCSQWKALVDGGALWLLKCQAEGFAGKEAGVDATESWQTFYFLHKKKRNLVKNPNGEEGLQHWEDVQNGGDGWKVEELPGDFGKDFPKEEVRTYFVSSFDWCSKSQIIDLQAEGYWEELMDTTQPKIVVKDWYAARCDAGCLYHLKVKLLSANEDAVAEFESETIAVPQDNEGEWAEITHTFADYGPGVRFVRFEHGGQDTVFWKGWYGARVTSSTVVVEP